MPYLKIDGEKDKEDVKDPFVSSAATDAGYLSVYVTTLTVASSIPNLKINFDYNSLNFPVLITFSVFALFSFALL